MDIEKPIKKLVLRSNYFSFKPRSEIQKYVVEINPSLPANKIQMVYRLLKNTVEIQNQLQPYIFMNYVLYSPTVTEQELSIKSVLEGQEYTILVQHIGTLTCQDDKEYLNFMGRFFKMIQARLKLQQIGRKYYDKDKAIAFKDIGIDIWPGYVTSLNQFPKELYMNIDTCFKVIRQETFYEYLQKLMKRYTEKQKIQEEVKGMTVMTIYNKRMYRVDNVDFDITPSHQFTLKNGKLVTFLEYYQKQYNSHIKDIQQPLIVHHQKNKKFMEKTDKITEEDNIIYLIPEFCVLTGLSDEMINNFRTMQKLAQVTKPNPTQRLQEASQLVKNILINPTIKSELEIWNIHISHEPTEITSVKIDAGDLVMGENQQGSRIQFPIEETMDFERKTQDIMYSQPNLDKWALFYPARDHQVIQNFLDVFKKCVDTYKYPLRQPRLIGVKGMKWEDWKNEMKILEPQVQAAIFVLSGPKKAAPLYNDIKLHLVECCPVPSQVILLKTIESGKGLRSICNKILIQLCAKVGGVPWTVNNLPFTDKPTMVVGIDVFHKAGKDRNQSVLAYCSSVNNSFSRYWSTLKYQEPMKELSNSLQTAVIDSLIEFYETNKLPPHRIIVYRDGISAQQLQALKDTEINSFFRAIDEFNSTKNFKENVELIYINVNKRVNAKFFLCDNLQRDNSMQNPPPGTLITNTVTTGTNFYLISQKTTQGSAAPSHYSIVFSNIDISDKILNSIQILTYKLSYTYYNWVGSIKVPAPIQYAHKLANFIADRWKHQIVNIHTLYGKRKSLFFI